MTWAIRSCALAAGAAALLSTQAVYAAPRARAAGVDPLVSLSLLGTVQSSAAVCGAAAGATAAASAAVQAPGACVLPVNPAPAAAPMGEAVAPVAPVAVAPAAGLGIGLLPLLAGLVAVAALAAVLATSGNNNGNGDLTPVSPV